MKDKPNAAPTPPVPPPRRAPRFGAPEDPPRVEVRVGDEPRLENESAFRDTMIIDDLDEPIVKPEDGE